MLNIFCISLKFVPKINVFPFQSVQNYPCKNQRFSNAKRPKCYQFFCKLKLVEKVNFSGIWGANKPFRYDRQKKKSFSQWVRRFFLQVLQVMEFSVRFCANNHSGDFCKPGGFARICTTDLQTPFRFAWLDLQLSLRFTRVQIYKFSKRQGLSLICNFWENEVHIDLQQNSHFF